MSTWNRAPKRGTNQIFYSLDVLTPKTKNQILSLICKRCFHNKLTKISKIRKFANSRPKAENLWWLRRFIVKPFSRTISTQKAKILAKNNKLGRLKAIKKYIRIFVFLDEISYEHRNKKYWRTRKMLWFSHSRDFQFSYLFLPNNI